uniref:Uncharacterized protein n=1 Tax=Ditylum brightwellii TaxID=49249 RepID=A0A7S4S2U0_9STRA
MIQEMEQRLNDETKSEPAGESTEEVAQLKQELESFRAANESAQAWMANAVTQLESLAKQIKELEEANAKLQADVVSRADEVSAVDEITQQLSEATAEIAALQATAEVASLQLDSEEKEEYKQKLEDEIVSYQEELQQLSVKYAEEVASKEEDLILLRNTVERLEDEALALKSDTETQLQINEEEIQRRDTMIQQESEDYRFEVAQHETKKEELILRLEEVEEELRHARDDVSQHQQDLRVREEELERIRGELDIMESDAVASKEGELGLLREQLKKQEHEASVLKCDMEKQLQLGEEETKRRDATIAQLEKEVRDLQLKFSTSDEDTAKLKEELSSLQLTIESNEEKLQFSNDELKLARGAVLQVQTHLDTNEEIRRNIENELGSKKEEIETLMSENSSHLSAIEDLRSKLTDFQSWAETAQQRIADLESDKDVAEQLAETQREEKEKIETVYQESEKSRAELQSQLNTMERKDKENQIIINESHNLQSFVVNLEISNKELVDRCERLEQDLKGANSEKSDLLEKVEKLHEKEIEISALQQELSASKERCEGITIQLQGTITDLQTKAKEVEHQNEGLRIEAEQAISEWEARCSFLHKELESASETESQFAKEKTLFSEQMEELVTAMKEQQEVINDLQSQVANGENAALSAEEQIDALTQEINFMNEQSEEVVNQWRERTEELEETINELETRICEQELAANDAIALWEARCDTLSKQMEELESTVNKSQQEQQILALSMQLRNAQELGTQKQGEVEVLNSRVDNLQSQLGILVKERDAAVEEKISITTDFELSAQEASSKLSSYQNYLDEVRAKYEQLTKDFDSKNRVLEEEKQAKIQLEESLFAEKQSKMEEKTLREANSKLISSLEDENRELEERSASALKEVSTMREMMEQLEEELQDANSALQSYLTDEVSTRVADMATLAVRNEISELRLQHASDQETLLTERNARLKAEQQVEKLSADIALLVPAGEEGESIDNLIRRTANKATEENIRREKHVINELRSGLDRAIEELAVARKSEKHAEERAASSRLHASVCEQELMAAKSDIDLLTQSIEEMREAEINTRSSLEYRINALEDDYDALTRSSADKIDSVKSELSQTTMEKERLAHDLKESEKANTALVYSTSVENQTGSTSPEKSELIMLRLEKVQLLAAVSEASARTERRVREAVAACASSYEADLIVEKELREAAEATLGDVQTRLEESNSRDEKADDNTQDATTSEEDENDAEHDSNLGFEIEKLKRDYELLVIKTETLQAENQELKKKLKKSGADSQISQEELLQKCRDLEAKVREVEREGHYEAAVAAEISRLRSESAAAAKSNFGQPENDDQPALNGDEKNEAFDNNMTVEDLYDHVFELKSEIREERMIYRDLLAEHEDLLALLAQQDLERASLHEALFNAGGDEAVENAIQEAEEKALNQFGKYIRVR